MKNKGLLGFFVFTIAVVLLVGITGANNAAAKDKIVIGQAVSLSGPNAIIHSSAAGPVQDMWVDEVNAMGGIYVKEYGKKLPIEVIKYDDKSDHGTMVKLIEKLILEDKVDLLFPPCSTSYLFAAAPIANKHEYVLMGAEGGATSLEKLSAELPYFFPVLNYSSHYQMPVFADLLASWGVKTAAITFNEDLHGVEYSNDARSEFKKKGIKIAVFKSHPLGIKDMSPILKEAKGANVDAFCSFSYPNESVLVTKQAIELAYNPKVFAISVGPCFAWFRDVFGADTINGLIGPGAWNCKSSAGAKEFCDKFIARYEESKLDYWGHLLYWGSLQFLEKAIEKAGTLNQKKIRDVIATERFDTALGSTWFDDIRRLARECHPGEMAQWQNGVFEVIDPGKKRTAEPIFPKPAWPTK